MANPFVFTDEQDGLRQSVRGYARGLLFDSYHERATSDEFPRDVYERLGKDGYLGLTVSEEFGGQGAELLTLGIASKEPTYEEGFGLGWRAFLSPTSQRLLPRPAVIEPWAQAGSMHHSPCA